MVGTTLRAALGVAFGGLNGLCGLQKCPELCCELPRGCQAGCCPSANTEHPLRAPASSGLAPAAGQCLGMPPAGRVSPSGTGKPHPSFPLHLSPPFLCGMSSHNPPKSLVAVAPATALQHHLPSPSLPCLTPSTAGARGSPLLSFSSRSQVKPRSF